MVFDGEAKLARNALHLRCLVMLTLSTAWQGVAGTAALSRKWSLPGWAWCGSAGNVERG